MRRKIFFAVVAWVLSIVTLCGCALGNSTREKIRDLDFTVLSEEKIPGELFKVIEERKAENFKLTYRDEDHLYIVIGYGQQETSGYSIAVNELYLTDQSIYVSTSLLGPDAADSNVKEASYPYIVIKTELLDETVIFE